MNTKQQLIKKLGDVKGEAAFQKWGPDARAVRDSYRGYRLAQRFNKAFKGKPIDKSLLPDFLAEL